MTQVERIFTASIGGEYSAVWYTSLFRTGWFGRKISFLNLFVLLFSTENLLYWEELGYHMLVSYPFHFTVNLCSHEVSITLLDITACCINSIQSQDPWVKPLGRASLLPSGMISTNTCRHPSGWSIQLPPPPSLRADPFRHPPPHTQKLVILLKVFVWQCSWTFKDNENIENYETLRNNI